MAKIFMLLDNAFHPDFRVYKEAKYLVNKGHEVTILALDRRSEFADRPTEMMDGISVVRFFCRDEAKAGRILNSRFLSKTKKLFYGVWFFSFIRQIKHYLKEHSCDYLHCHNWYVVVAGWLARQKRCPLVFDMHEYYEHQVAKNKCTKIIFRLWIGFLQNRSSYIIYVHEIQTSHISKRNRKKLIFLPNYPDITVLKPIDHKIPSEKLRVGYVGYVRGNIKWYQNLLAASRGKDVELHIHGAGELYEQVKEMSIDMPNVSLTGRFHLEQDFYQMYANFDILYIFPEEGAVWIQPTKFFEAMITRTPYIAQKGTYLAQFASDHGVGFPIDMYDDQSVEKILRELIGHRERITSAVENIKKIQYDYDWNKVVVNLDKIYKR